MQPNEMSAYKGDKPYIFVSYAHKDAKVVIPLIKALQDAGYRIWFDLGIEVGTEWSNNIANHLRDSSAFLFFTSQNSVQSENCLDEVAFAKSHNKSAVLVYLEEDVVLPAGTEMQTARFQRMYANRQNDMESFVKGFSETDIFDACREEGEHVISDGVVATNEKSAKTPIVKLPFKLSKGAYIGIAAAVVAIIVAITVILGLGGDDKPKTEDEKPEVIVLSNKLEDQTFRLDGKVYKLPFNYSTLVADGWTIYTPTISSESYIGGQSEETIIIVKDGKSVSVSVYNDGENAKKLKDCLVGGIMVYADEITDFCIAAEVTPKTTELEMIEKFGTPAERSEYANYIRLTWSLGEMSQVQATVYEGDNADQSYIQIKHYVLSSEKFEVKKEAPKFLNEYSAPTQLGDNLYSGIFWVGGDFYELPVPLREFTKKRLDNYRRQQCFDFGQEGKLHHF